MKQLRGARLAVVATVLGLLTLLGTGYAFRHSIAEEWQLRRLDSAEPEIRDLAVRKLGEMRSVKALPYLKERFLAPGRRFRGIDDPCTKALINIGPPALPIAEAALTSPDPNLPMSGFLVVDAISRKEGSETAAGAVLLRQLEHPDMNVRVLAGGRLRSMIKNSKVQPSPGEMQRLDQVYPEGTDPMSLLQGIMSRGNNSILKAVTQPTAKNKKP
jgi:hypothetical protein